MWLRRWKLSRGISRPRLARPVAVAASGICAATIFELAATVPLSAGPATLERIYTVESYAQIGVPAAFVISIMQRRFARTRIVDLLLHLSGPARAPSVAERAAGRLRGSRPGGAQLAREDPAPGPALASWRPEPGSSQTAAGGCCRSWPARASSSRSSWPTRPCHRMTTWSGRPSRPARSPWRTRTWKRPCGRSCRRSGTRGCGSSRPGRRRRRLERDLHDGTQQRLLGSDHAGRGGVRRRRPGARRSSPGSGASWPGARRAAGPGARDPPGGPEPGRAGRGHRVHGRAVRHSHPGRPAAGPVRRGGGDDRVLPDRRVRHQRHQARAPGGSRCAARRRAAPCSSASPTTGRAAPAWRPARPARRDRPGPRHGRRRGHRQPGRAGHADRGRIPCA